MMVSHKIAETGQFAAIMLSVLDFQKKMFGPADPQVFIFGRHSKYSSRQNMWPLTRKRTLTVLC